MPSSTKNIVLVYLDTYDNKLITFTMYKDNETAPYFAADITVAGYRLGYDYMFAPALLYIKNLPGAITDVDKIVQKWDDLSLEGNPFIQIYRCDGITYTRIKYTDEDIFKLRRDIEISVTVDLNHTIGSTDSASDTSADTDIEKNNVSVQSGTENNNYITNNTQSQKANNSNQSNSTETSHMCILEPQYEIIHHDEVGHYEDVQVYEWVTLYCCPVCYNKYETVEECHEHAIGHNNEYFSFEVDEYETTETYRPRTEQRWFVDEIEWDEKVIVSNKCITCGKVVKQ